jgi:hypothetical protein
VAAEGCRALGARDQDRRREGRMTEVGPDLVVRENRGKCS